MRKFAPSMLLTLSLAAVVPSPAPTATAFSFSGCRWPSGTIVRLASEAFDFLPRPGWRKPFQGEQELEGEVRINDDR